MIDTSASALLGSRPVAPAKILMHLRVRTSCSHTQGAQQNRFFSFWALAVVGTEV
jgi:hypothetical protein